MVAVQADLIEGVLIANALAGADAEAPRRELWNALVDGGDAAGESVAA